MTETRSEASSAGRDQLTLIETVGLQASGDPPLVGCSRVWNRYVPALVALKVFVIAVVEGRLVKAPPFLLTATSCVKPAGTAALPSVSVKVVATVPVAGEAPILTLILPCMFVWIEQ